MFYLQIYLLIGMVISYDFTRDLKDIANSLFDKVPVAAYVFAYIVLFLGMAAIWPFYLAYVLFLRFKNR